MALVALPAPSHAGSDQDDVEAPSAAGSVFDYPQAKLGAFVALDEHNGTKERAAHLGFERKWKRQEAFLRSYVNWDEPKFFTSAQRKLAADGRTIVLSWSSYEHRGGVRWEDIADGQYDAMIDERAAEIIDFGHPIAFNFQHEPDNQVDRPEGLRAGTPRDYCNAYKHVIGRFRAAGVQNATYGVILMAWSARSGNASKYVCGGKTVEYLGVDGFNWYGCEFPDGPWRMPDDIFGPWLDWASDYDLPVIIAEWGTGEDSAVPGRKAEWITAMGQLVKDHPQVKASLIFNAAFTPACPRYSDTSRSSQRAFVRMGADPYFNPEEQAAQ